MEDAATAQFQQDPCSWEEAEQAALDALSARLAVDAEVRGWGEELSVVTRT